MTRPQRGTAAPGSAPVSRLVAPGQPVSAAELRAVLADPGLSFAAKGVLALVLSRPAGAVIGLGELFAASADPMPVVERAVAELVRAGLLSTTQPGRAADRAAGGVVFGCGRRARGKGGLTAASSRAAGGGRSPRRQRARQAPKRRSAWGQRTPLTTTRPELAWSVPAGRESDRTRWAHTTTSEPTTTTRTDAGALRSTRLVPGRGRGSARPPQAAGGEPTPLLPSGPPRCTTGKEDRCARC
jgi:hypothetical protein